MNELIEIIRAAWLAGISRDEIVFEVALMKGPLAVNIALLEYDRLDNMEREHAL